jgi:hypothetical protein
LINLCEIDSLLEHFVAIHLHEELWHSGQEGGAESGNFWTLARGFHKFFQVLVEESDVLSGPILQDKGESARSANARNRRRRKGKGDALADFREFAVQSRFDRVILLFRFLTLAPLIQSNKEEPAVSVLHIAQKAETYHARRVFDAGRFAQDFLDFPTSFIRALERCRIRQLQGNVKIALIFFRQKARRQFRTEKPTGNREGKEQGEAEETLVHGQPRQTHVAIRCAAEKAIKSIVKPTKRTACFFLRTKQE